VSLRPRLLILSFSPIVSDARVLKQVRHFADRYDVTTCGYGEHPGGAVHHIRIPDDQPYNERSGKLLLMRRYRKHYWRTAAVTYARDVLQREERFDIILANDIDTVGVALALEPVLGVHADIHEYAPRQNEEMPVWKYFVGPYMRWMCRTQLTKATSVTTVGKGVAAEYRRVFGITAGVVTNSAPYADLRPSPVGQPIRIVHSGAALRNRHLEVMIEAVARSSAPVTLDLFLMPNDVEYLEEMKHLASAGERVVVREPVPYSELLATLNEFDLGIHVIPPVNFNNAWSLPNKFFDYIQARLGLVIGPSPEMKETLDSYGLGVASTGFSVADVTATLDELTPDAVAGWKRDSDAAAEPLSAGRQVDVWDAAIAAIAASATPAAPAGDEPR
jgi:hypothetical protein